MNDRADLDKLTVTAEDVIESLTFFEHFKIPIEPQIQAMIDDLKNGAPLTLQVQNDVKDFLVRAIAARNHEATADTLFDDIAIECQSILDGTHESQDDSN